MSDVPSKKDIRTEAARLRRRPGWNPHQRVTTDPMEQLRALDQERQNERTYDDSTDCQLCQEQRQETDDPSALCEEHLQQALGFS